jgi:RNA polymerase sigma-70 factor (ECF subfamily)
MSNNEAERRDFKQAALEHLDALYGFAVTLTRDRAEAEDLVQETYLRAVRAFGGLYTDSNLKGWLFTIMRNVWLNQLRHSRTGPLFVELDGEGPERPSLTNPEADPYAALVSKLTRNEVRAAIESLPVHYREVVVLRDLEGFSYQEIANILGCPAGTVMSRLGRAREKLRSVLEQWNGDATINSVRANEA